MFEFLKRLFGRKKAEEETVMEENKVELTPIGADEEIKDIEMPASRYTEEYAEFVESQIPEQPQKSLAEEMMEDPFADVAAQDEDFGVPEIAEEEPAPEAEEEEKKKSLAEQMQEDPFADLSAEYEEIE
ncbi:MAG: hypothetical protein E7194_06425 [Erysipelotrichaceae bacterium]|nr:hypothetical protein [Erysipelotrichaceae bacterium]